MGEKNQVTFSPREQFVNEFNALIINNQDGGGV
jgi:hypothetical protein